MTAQPTGKQLRKAAVKLAREGQPVFPVKAMHGAKSKAPLTKNGVLDATTDEEKIKRWFKRHDNRAGIGIATGVLYDVLDVDVKEGHDGRVHLPMLNRLGLLNGCKFCVKTPSGGWHLYFLATPGMTNKASAELGMDVRGKGGYVLAPPSFIVTDQYAGAYELVGETKGSTNEPLRWDLIKSVLQPENVETSEPISLLPSERRASIAALREWVAARLPGERNNALHWAVCRCIDNNIDPRELVEAALLSGLGEEEIMLTINSALKRAGLNADHMDTEAEAMFGRL